MASVASQLSTTEKSVVLTFQAADRLTTSGSSTVAPSTALTVGPRHGSSVTTNQVDTITYFVGIYKYLKKQYLPELLILPFTVALSFGKSFWLKTCI